MIWNEWHSVKCVSELLVQELGRISYSMALAPKELEDTGCTAAVVEQVEDQEFAEGAGSLPDEMPVVVTLLNPRP